MVCSLAYPFPAGKRVCPLVWVFAYVSAGWRGRCLNQSVVMYLFPHYISTSSQPKGQGDYLLVSCTPSRNIPSPLSPVLSSYFYIFIFFVSSPPLGGVEGEVWRLKTSKPYWTRKHPPACIAYERTCFWLGSIDFAR